MLTLFSVDMYMMLLFFIFVPSSGLPAVVRTGWTATRPASWPLRSIRRPCVGLPASLRRGLFEKNTSRWSQATPWRMGAWWICP